MKLTSLKIENFKRIAAIDIPLSDMNILVGVNGCGKSSVVQAVHLACCVMRQADRVDPSKTSTVSTEDLDYLPTDDYKTLGHGANWGNKDGSPSSQVTLTFQKATGETVVASCRLRSARNAGISITGSVHGELTSSLRSKKKFFSAYIPGISGIPNREERKSKKVIMKACSFGDSNVILRNALLLLKENDPQNLHLIEEWIGKITGPVSILVEHNNDSDLYIHCNISQDGTTKPLELVGTGYIQLIQIFCYVLLFSPGVLLIDEPDIHLHPHVQERLVRVLADVARERGVRVLLTTHSPFIVRGAPVGTNVCWVHAGAIESRRRDLVERALGWGAFGKKVIIVSEDSDTSLLQKVVSQWPGLDSATAFCPGIGYKNAPTPRQARELHETLGSKFKILVHRDRDSLTEDEVNTLIAQYEAEDVSVWFPAESDVEAYYCQPTFLEVFLGCTQEQAIDYLTWVLDHNGVPIRDQFNSHRAAHNDELHKAGGSPLNEDVWASFQTRPLRGAKGKYVFGQLKNRIPAGAFSPDKILNATLGGQVGLDLKHKIESLLAE